MQNDNNVLAQVFGSDPKDENNRVSVNLAQPYDIQWQCVVENPGHDWAGGTRGRSLPRQRNEHIDAYPGAVLLFLVLSQSVATTRMFISLLEST